MIKRGLLWVALLLSLGFNLGVVATLVRDRPAPPPATPAGEEPEEPEEALAESTPPVPEDEASPAVGKAEPDASMAEPEARTAEPEAGSAAPAAPAAVDPPAAESAAPVPEERVPEVVAPVAASAPQRQQPEPQLVDRLGLEGEQRAEFVRLQQELAAKVRAMQPRIERARGELYRELSAAAPDRQRIEQRVIFLGRASAELERAFADTALRSRELLDGEQEQIYLRALSRRARMVRDGHRPQAPRRDLGPRAPAGRPRFPR